VTTSILIPILYLYVKDIGGLERYLGIRVVKNKGGQYITIDQKEYRPY
jgi:hypothetical protein